MHFKLNNRNPYRNLVANALAIHKMDISQTKKLELYKQLYKLLKDKLVENERFLTSSPAFATRCQHWNQRDVDSIRPIKTLRNPWLLFKRQFEQALKNNDAITISRELGWFKHDKNQDDWLSC